MSNNYITIATCNFNTTELTNNLLNSIKKKFNKYKYELIILDNSNKIPFILKSNIKYHKNCINIKILNNYNSKYINFDNILNTCPYKLMPNNGNNYGSLKHAFSIQFLLNICTTKYLLLFDSDTELLKDIDFISNNYITVSDIEYNNKIDSRMNNKIYTSKTRFMPFIQLFNIDKINKAHLKYFDYSRMHGVLAPNRGNYYDTGASFYEDIIKNKLNFLQISYSNYINHLDHGSWKNNV